MRKLYLFVGMICIPAAAALIQLPVPVQVHHPSAVEIRGHTAGLMVCPVCITAALVANAPAIAVAAACASVGARAAKAASGQPLSVGESAALRNGPPASQQLKAEQRKPMSK